MPEWSQKDFSRRSYAVEGGDLGKGKLEVLVRLAGKTLMQLELREPGMVAIISHPSEEGVRAELVAPGGRREAPGGPEQMALLEWQAEALGVGK
jgi:hypothetical protein